MKKVLIALVIFINVCVFGVALAETNPSAKDVPLDSWAYPAVQRLIKIGLINDYPDGTFRGDKSISRYEMAQLVDKALQNEDKATREQKALIDKLAIEFALELNQIDTRVTTLEKNQSSLKITGFFNSRSEWLQHPKKTGFTGLSPYIDPTRDGIADSSNTLRNSLWLYVDNKFDGNTYFHGLLETETVSGRSTDATLNLLEGFVATKVGNTEIAVGRYFPSIGMGFFGSPWMDGARLSFGNDVKIRLFSTKLLTNTITYASSTYNMADAHYALNKDINMSLGYVADKQKDVYNDYAVGLEFKGIPDLNLKGEYASNSSVWAKSQNNNSNSKAYFVTLKYKGANPLVPGSFGLRVEYKHADPGFDYLSYAAPFEWNAPLNWTQAPQGGYNDNIKGFEYGFDYAIAPRLILDARYDILKTTNGHPITCSDGNFTSQNFATVQVTYFF